MNDFSHEFLAELVLEDGSRFEGCVPDLKGLGVSGEVVFTTGMTGYVESLTDPSFSGQILVFTYPLIGNYGVFESDQWESDSVVPRAVIIGEGCLDWSHSGSICSLFEWLKKHDVPLLTGVDTRALTKRLREEGVMLGAVVEKGSAVSSFDNPNDRCLAEEVTVQAPIERGKGQKKIILVDNGMKASIARQLETYPISILQVPYDYDYTDESYDAVFLSNGPGDPASMQKGVAILQKALRKEKPVFGVCMGMQLLGLAATAKTYKLRYGHRGQNQPCLDLKSGRSFLTSQNHGFAIDRKTLPREWTVRFENLNDETVEGIEHRTLPFLGVQFHPEASPGPLDTKWLFDEFIERVGI